MSEDIKACVTDELSFEQLDDAAGGVKILDFTKEVNYACGTIENLF
jgi:hypothetical protein